MGSGSKTLLETSSSVRKGRRQSIKRSSDQSRSGSKTTRVVCTKQPVKDDSHIENNIPSADFSTAVNELLLSKSTETTKKNDNSKSNETESKTISVKHRPTISNMNNKTVNSSNKIKTAGVKTNQPVSDVPMAEDKVVRVDDKKIEIEDEEMNFGTPKKSLNVVHRSYLSDSSVFVQISSSSQDSIDEKKKILKKNEDKKRGGNKPNSPISSKSKSSISENRRIKRITLKSISVRSSVSPQTTKTKTASSLSPRRESNTIHQSPCLDSSAVVVRMRPRESLACDQNTTLAHFGMDVDDEDIGDVNLRKKIRQEISTETPADNNIIDNNSISDSDKSLMSLLSDDYFVSQPLPSHPRIFAQMEPGIEKSSNVKNCNKLKNSKQKSKTPNDSDWDNSKEILLINSNSQFSFNMPSNDSNSTEANSTATEDEILLLSVTAITSEPSGNMSQIDNNNITNENNFQKMKIINPEKQNENPLGDSAEMKMDSEMTSQINSSSSFQSVNIYGRNESETDKEVWCDPSDHPLMADDINFEINSILSDDDMMMNLADEDIERVVKQNEYDKTNICENNNNKENNDQNNLFMTCYLAFNHGVLDDVTIWPLNQLKILCHRLGLSTRRDDRREALLAALKNWNSTPSTDIKNSVLRALANFIPTPWDSPISSLLKTEGERRSIIKKMEENEKGDLTQSPKFILDDEMKSLVTSSERSFDSNLFKEDSNSNLKKKKKKRRPTPIRPSPSSNWTSDAKSSFNESSKEQSAPRSFFSSKNENSSSDGDRGSDESPPIPLAYKPINNCNLMNLPVANSRSLSPKSVATLASSLSKSWNVKNIIRDSSCNNSPNLDNREIHNPIVVSNSPNHLSFNSGGQGKPQNGFSSGMASSWSDFGMKSPCDGYKRLLIRRGSKDQFNSSTRRKTKKCIKFSQYNEIVVYNLEAEERQAKRRRLQHVAQSTDINAILYPCLDLEGDERWDEARRNASLNFSSSAVKSNFSSMDFCSDSFLFAPSWPQQSQIAD